MLGLIDCLLLYCYMVIESNMSTLQHFNLTIFSTFQLFNLPILQPHNIFKKNQSEIKKILHLQPQQGGIIAQSVEQRTENPCVAGSIPADTTKFKRSFSNEKGPFCIYKVHFWL